MKKSTHGNPADNSARSAAHNPGHFSENKDHLFIKGPVGCLEVKTDTPFQENDAILPMTVIISHPHPLFGGTMENKVVTTIFRTFQKMGARVVRFNYRGVGQSKGEYDEARGETEDLLAIMAWVEIVRPHDHIWLVGFSFGAYVATRAASSVLFRKKVKQLITIAPPVNHFDFTKKPLPDASWLVIQGDSDEIVPPEQVFNWVDEQVNSNNPPKLIKVSGVGHFFHGRLLELRDILNRAF